MSVIEAEQLCKVYPVALKDPGLMGSVRHFFKRRFRDIEAVKGVSFRIEPGEVVGFLGPNGAGKTTTLKMLTGLIRPSSGSCRVAGAVPFRREPAFLNQISLVMGQKQQLIWDLPALDSLRINGAVYGISDRDLDRRIGELAEMLSLQQQLRQPVRKLSLGERMKAELLAALLHGPKVLFLDEPTLGLDVNAQTAVREFLATYNERYRATILLTSHYMADITRLCDRVIVIHYGSLIYDGELDGLLDRFAPYRQIQLDLESPRSPEDLSRYGEVESCDGLSVRLLVKRSQLTETVTRLLADLPVNDLRVEDPPVEEVIGRVFSAGAVA
ncbi:ABC transporter ATP-binding protein [Synechococcus elongatus]|uniref:ABC transporter ATP-binding protein n=1 Tax=Synechococcus elongatus TaxID=32046 RepID=UPI0002DEFCC6|nr:ATP-binding cassette domain-containing protein [Synechococcus elongatus]AJD56739.1 ABC transporter [Synechococcus elongatus UTEX 2973]MBD2588042.1 ATP-binding cassette domain-containing protein [Synechococcus elongatus FACHB-242]MBD2689110.1 ATP-binding cassette domain-containing protein [Synechococcus elongatus FACHB-1061]MBD2707250.1 ATP-binding cassette domain-containing protein [Synechococcus elongatus PCC 7942 = FACHB-805]UOW69960.1 ATP-binding cassette domain-containing protein [Synec